MLNVPPIKYHKIKTNKKRQEKKPQNITNSFLFFTSSSFNISKRSVASCCLVVPESSSCKQSPTDEEDKICSRGITKTRAVAEMFSGEENSL